MISYGSQQRSAEMPCDNRSHQLGSQKINAETLCEKRSHQLGEGQSINTGMLGVVHPSQPVTGGQSWIAEMPKMTRPHQFWATSTTQQC